MFPLLLAELEDRLRSHKDRAEAAYVTDHTARCSKNCRHALELTDGTFGCQARRWGSNEEEAATCSDTKVLACPGFQPHHDEPELRDRFRSIPEAELALRWTSINELLWARRQIQDRMNTPSPPSPSLSSAATPPLASTPATAM